MSAIITLVHCWGIYLIYYIEFYKTAPRIYICTQLMSGYTRDGNVEFAATDAGIYEFDNDKLAGTLCCAHYGIIQHYRSFRR